MAVRCYGCMAMKNNSPVCEHCGYDETKNNGDHQLPAGTLVGGQYLLGRVLGQGGFGITYLGWDTVMHTRVAVKEYFPMGFAGRNTGSRKITSYDTQGTDAFELNKRRFLRESDSLARLWNTPQIVKVLRHFEENGTAYIAMEYVEGRDLRKFLKERGKPLTMEEALSVLGPILEALTRIHSVELVHRDISPDNIMVLPDGSAKLLDFGAARYVENPDAEQDRNTSTQAILKHGFAPPEQYQSHGALGPWTDEYAICATFYYCLTGKIPPEAMSRIMEGKQLNWDQVPGLTEGQRAALEKGMSLQPRDRFPTVKQLRQQLTAEEAPEPGEVQSTEQTQITSSPPPKERTVSEEKTLHRPEPVQTSEQKATPQKQITRSTRVHPSDVRKTSAKPAIPEAPEPPEPETTAPMPEAVRPVPGKRRRWPAAAAAVLAIAGAAILFFGREQVPGTGPSVSDVLPGASLKIAPSLSLEGVDVGHMEQIPVLSSHGSEEIQWTSSDPLVAAVSETGSVTALGYGTAEITAEYRGERAVCTVSVELNPNVTCTYEANATGVTITGYQGTLPQHIVLPKTINGQKVTAIGNDAFRECFQLLSVAIPDSVSTIEHFAFGWCSNLTEITLPESVTSIGNGSFRECTGLTGIRIPERVCVIGDYAFEYCTNLENVSIPESVSYIGASAFLDTPWLAAQTAEFVIRGDGVLLKYNGTSRHVVVPSTVKSISSAFENNTKIVSITILDNVSSIADSAFSGCSSLTTVSIPNSISSIGYATFQDCTSLTGISLPDSITSIEGSAFYGCSSLSEIAIPDGVSRIGDSAFHGCTSLTKVSLPESISAIVDSTFYGCSSLAKIVIPDRVSFIGNSAFYGCSSLAEIVIPDRVNTIGDSAFYGCGSLRQITIPDGITSIEDFTFRECSSLADVTLPASVSSIGRGAFWSCSSLREIVIPESVSSIGVYAFWNCTNLTEVTLPEHIPYIQDGAFAGCTILQEVTVPRGCSIAEDSFPDSCTVSYF